jgi:pimeloyl-ACP methyl ester carboxylesterase
MKPISLLLCCLLLSSFLYAQKNVFGNNSNVGKYYYLRGIKLYTEEYGQGKPLLLLHGNGGSISSMSSIIPYFSERYRTIAVDSRAHGKSIDSNDSLSFEMMADDVAFLLDQMKIDSAYIIGWSDGGIIALEIALRHPEKIIKLVSTGANLWPDSTALMPALWKDEKEYYNSQIIKPKITIDEKNSWKIFMLDWEQPNISLASIRKIKTPSLIICGDHDIIRIEHTVQIFQNIPNAALWILPNSGHGTLIEHPGEFCETVDHFLNPVCH